MLKPGQAAPEAMLVASDGSPCALSSTWAAGPALLVFYPGDDTAVCTKQLCEYRDHWQEFTRRGVRLVGINPADAQRHRRFAERHSFPFPILSDPGGACCRAYGAAAWYGTRRLVTLVERGVVRAGLATMPFLRPRLGTVLAAVDALGGP